MLICLFNPKFGKFQRILLGINFFFGLTGTHLYSETWGPIMFPSVVGYFPVFVKVQLYWALGFFAASFQEKKWCISDKTTGWRFLQIAMQPYGHPRFVANATQSRSVHWFRNKGMPCQRKRHWKEKLKIWKFFSRNIANIKCASPTKTLRINVLCFMEWFPSHETGENISRRLNRINVAPSVHILNEPSKSLSTVCSHVEIASRGKYLQIRLKVLGLRAFSSEGSLRLRRISQESVQREKTHVGYGLSMPLEKMLSHWALQTCSLSRFQWSINVLKTSLQERQQKWRLNFFAHVSDIWKQKANFRNYFITCTKVICFAVTFVPPSREWTATTCFSGFDFLN